MDENGSLHQGWIESRQDVRGTERFDMERDLDTARNDGMQTANLHCGSPSNCRKSPRFWRRVATRPSGMTMTWRRAPYRRARCCRLDRKFRLPDLMASAIPASLSQTIVIPHFLVFPAQIILDRHVRTCYFTATRNAGSKPCPPPVQFASQKAVLIENSCFPVFISVQMTGRPSKWSSQRPTSAWSTRSGEPRNPRNRHHPKSPEVRKSEIIPCVA